MQRWVVREHSRRGLHTSCCHSQYGGGNGHGHESFGELAKNILDKSWILVKLLILIWIFCFITFQDVAGKILSFSQKGPRGICILSANGAVSNVTIRQPGSSGGILTFEVSTQTWNFVFMSLISLNFSLLSSLLSL